MNLYHDMYILNYKVWFLKAMSSNKASNTNI